MFEYRIVKGHLGRFCGSPGECPLGRKLNKTKLAKQVKIVQCYDLFMCGSPGDAEAKLKTHTLLNPVDTLGIKFAL